MIIRFNPEGRVTMVVGRKQEASDESTGPLKHPIPPLPAEDGRFRQPTDVAFSAEGDIFISDGYINSRVAKADKDGSWIKSWGNRGNNPGEFNTPHNIGADSQGRIYVADRGNRRIQVFDSQGNFVRVITIDVPFDENARPAIGNKPDLKTYQQVLTFVPGAPWTICITPPPNEVLYTSDAWPSVQADAGWQGVACVRSIR